MQITPAILDAIFQAFRLDFQAAYEGTPTWYNLLSTIVPSGTRENRYAWMKKIPRVREWIGERKFNNLVARGYTIINKSFEDSIAIDRDNIEDDQIGVYTADVAMLGSQSAKWMDDLMVACIQAGSTTGLCFDGQPFFNDSHPVDSDVSTLGVYSNNFPNMPLTRDNFITVRQTMVSQLGEDGKPLGIMPRQLIVPPQLEFTAKSILNASIIARTVQGTTAGASETNVLQGMAEVLVVPELSNQGDTWYLADSSKPIKAFVAQVRKAPVMTQLVSPTDANVFLHKQYYMGTEMRGNTGYSLPFLASRATAQVS